MLTGLDTATSTRSDSSKRKGAVLVRDNQSCLPLFRTLEDGDLVILLTPVVAPIVPGSRSPASRGVTSDPFEPLGRALAKRHPWIRHVPYTAGGGVTSTHVGFIKRAAAVVFVISGPPTKGQTSQVELSEIARSIGEQRPHIIVACCNIEELGILEADFPTIIQLPNYSPIELESAAELLWGKSAQTASTGPKLQSLMVSPKTWPIEVWNGNRNPIDGVHELWLECMPRKFYLNQFTFQSLLRRDGYAMHYVVREPETREILGFCATYTTYIGSGGESLIGSLSTILVRPSYRQRGVGLSLHNHALRQLTKTRGVDRLQLGSTFPRLLFGLPVDGASDEWFRRRGWRMDQQGPGAGQEVCDWLLRINDWLPRPLPATGGLEFRVCELPEFDRVLDMVERESARNDNVGWYDQYAKLANTMNVRDIVIGIEDETVVAAALTFVKNTGSPVAEDIPWPSAIGDDVGGVTCICITEPSPSLSYERDAIMIRLLDECIRTLSEQGMQRLFVDAIRGGDQGFQSTGFQKWARYRDIWRKA
ncbi:hypothetical protein CONLIGDRAFT_332240 [Coniochaeta ligniaria NRRL 30616]|uniref:N-acetyltransferase domain-containing protein n=1 Tax=Coniochaeta ligniaria NRRL 30616 TaxID=1408157 RepID=A0A1J7IQA0_9PEZI|nr:hypothetical protein CONLIGDRAFT_332240 [Coniochaeta ligniaria NRRL 30616]